MGSRPKEESGVNGAVPQENREKDSEGGNGKREIYKARRRRKKKKREKRKDIANEEAESAVHSAPSPMYTVDGEKFFQSRAELERHLSGKYRKKSPPKRRKKKNESMARKSESIETTRAAALDLAATATATGSASDAVSQGSRSSTSFLPSVSPLNAKNHQRPPRPLTPCNPEKDLGGEFAPLFFDKTDEWARQEEAFACAQDARKVSDDLFDKVSAVTGEKQQRFTTDNVHFFPSMGALRKFYVEVEKGKLPALSEAAIKEREKRHRRSDRLRSAMPSWWTGMPVNEKAEWEAYSLPPTPATTVTTASERTRTASTPTKDTVKKGDNEPEKKLSAENAQLKAEIVGRRGGKSALDIFLEKEAAAIAAAAAAEEAAHEAAEAERAERLNPTPSKWIQETPRIEYDNDGSPIKPSVALSPCKEWSLWTPVEMRTANFQLARMIGAFESDFTKLMRVSLQNCRLDQKDCTTIAHALRLPSTKIVYLDLSYNQLTGRPDGNGGPFYDFSGMDRLCNAILWSKTLRVLSLAGNALLSSGARSLAFPLARNALLEELDVSDTLMGLGLGTDDENKNFEDNGGIAEFAHALARNNNLRHLRMFSVVLGSAAASELAAAICARGTLTSFCDLPVSGVLLHNGVREMHICGHAESIDSKGSLEYMQGAFEFTTKMTALMDAQILAEEEKKKRGVTSARDANTPNPSVPLPKMLGLHGVTTAVYLLHGLYERYDNCYMPRSALKKLTFSQIILEEETCMELAAALALNRRLTSLDVFDGGIESPKGLEAIAHSLKSNNSLLSLRLAGHQRLCSATKHGSLSLIKPFCDLFIGNMARSCRADIVEPVMLRVVSLAGNGIGGVACAALSASLQNDRVLTDLDISSNPITLGNAGLAQSIFDTLLGGSHCSDLDGISKKSRKSSAKKSGLVKSNQGIVRLSVADCSGCRGKMTPKEREASMEMCKSLKRALIQNSCLTMLDLSCNRLDDTVSESITEAVLKSSTLCGLILSHNRFSAASVPHFTRMVRKSSSLCKLSLANNPMLFDGVQSMRTGKEDGKAVAKFLGQGLRWADFSETGMTGMAALNALRFCLVSDTLRTLKMSRNMLRECSTTITTKILPEMAQKEGSSLIHLYIEDAGLVSQEGECSNCIIRPIYPQI